MNLGEVCEHGSLASSCLICELTAERAALLSILGKERDEFGKKETELKAEVERLKRRIKEADEELALSTMAFTDKDLKRLKSFLRTEAPGSFEFGKDECEALLARLEAHEALEPFIIDCLNWEEDETKPNKWWDDFTKAHDAWRKSKGE